MKIINRIYSIACQKDIFVLNPTSRLVHENIEKIQSRSTNLSVTITWKQKCDLYRSSHTNEIQ